VEYGPDNSFRLREQPTAADYAHAKADEADAKAGRGDQRMQCLLQILSGKGLLTLEEVNRVWSAGPR
jgi:hypothetical protein